MWWVALAGLFGIASVYLAAAIDHWCWRRPVRTRTWRRVVAAALRETYGHSPAVARDIAARVNLPALPTALGRGMPCPEHFVRAYVREHGCRPGERITPMQPVLTSIIAGSLASLLITGRGGYAYPELGWALGLVAVFAAGAAGWGLYRGATT